MTYTSVILPDSVKTFCAVLNVVACGVFVIIRIYHQKKDKIQNPKLSLTGLLSIFSAFLYCLTALNLDSKWYFGDIRRCTLSIKMLPAGYSAHRFLLYIFIILRVEVVNQTKFVSPRILSLGKAVVGVFGIVATVLNIIFTEGVPDEHSQCSFFHSENSVLVAIFVVDAIICVTGTWLFAVPIKDVLSEFESSHLRHMLRWTKIWSIVCLVSTLVALLIVVFIDGVGGVISFDCSITSFALVMMMSPKSNRLQSESSVIMEIKGNVELEKSPHKPSQSPHKSPNIKRGATEKLNEQIDALLYSSSSTYD